MWFFIFNLSLFVKHHGGGERGGEKGVFNFRKEMREIVIFLNESSDKKKRKKD
jgi:hypothetical protein